jgi:quercetin dioxygenase-like cupin family protein
MTTSIHVTQPEETTPLWVLGDEIRFTGSLEARDLHVIEVRVPPGSGTPPHRHESIEIFRVTEGEITFGVFGEGPPREIVGRPGTVVTLPSNVGHNYANRSGRPAVMTAVVEGQMRDFFREVGRPTPPPPGPPPAAAIEAVLSICRRRGIEMLAPAP